MEVDKDRLYRSIPRTDAILADGRILALVGRYGRRTVLAEIHRKQDELRRRIADLETGEDAADVRMQAERLIPDIGESVRRLYEPGMRKVINATGTLLHTNLGRAPLPREMAGRLAELMCSYSNLEYSLEKGEREERGTHVAKLLRRLTGAEDALAVNNNAGAVLLILHTLARGGEVIVSRGELVEVGGRFRIPDVMELGGVTLREVGTTNKTRIEDYEGAFCGETRAVLKVHTSNYRVMGFTESVPAAELTAVAASHGTPVVEDLGSGVMLGLEQFGLAHEPTVQEAIAAGVDVVCFSGDKLLGGPQAGIILGKREYIDRIRKNPLIRALRVDKFTEAALEMVLIEYLYEDAADRIPVLRMLSAGFEDTLERAGTLLLKMEEAIGPGLADLTVRECEACAGGGSLPATGIRSAAVVISPLSMTAAALERAMRRMPCPVIGRVADDAVWLDVRTVDDSDFELIAGQMAAVMGEPG